MSIQLNAFLLVFVAIGCGQCLATYLKYEIGPEFCSNPEIQIKNDFVFNTSIILESSEFLSESCFIRIIGSPKVDGLIVNVHNLSISNGLNKSCDNNIEFGSSPIIEWCDTSDANTLIFEKSSLDIAFKSDSNHSLSFKLVVTPFEKPVNGEKCVSSAPFGCQTVPMNCISEIFRCDGFNNCPNNTDEKDCSKILEPKVLVQTLKQIQNKVTANSGYNIYNLTDYCNKSVAQVIELGADSSAILQLSEEDSYLLNQTDCSLRFSSSESLIIGIDFISIGNNDNTSCDDFLQISNGKSNVTWCSNKTDKTGISFNERKDTDFMFHAGSHSNSSLSLVITPYKSPLFGKCFSFAKLRCGSSDNQCISKRFQCDHHNNCPKGEDESKCPRPPPTPIPTTTTTPIPTTTTSIPTTTTTPKTTTTTTTTSPTTTHHTTTTTTETPQSTTPTPSSHQMSPGMIALTVIGTLIGVILIGIVAYICYKRRVANPGYNALN